LLTPPGQMPFWESFASGPVGTPAIYDPAQLPGSRWSNAGLSNSPIARLYHSSAILLPDASVLIAGSNPNLDVNITALYPTTYTAEKFYPPYFSASTRPAPSGVPSKLSYGGDAFDITIPASSYTGSGNTAAGKTVVSVIRGGWTTHAMNMGQRYLQLNNTYTVNKDGSIVLHVAQMPPNPNLFQPGPALLFVVINGIPSNGTYVIIGSGNIETQPTSAASVLPDNVLQADASGTASGSSTSSGSNKSTAGTSHTVLIASIAGGVGLLALGVFGVGVCLSRRRRRARIRSGIAASKAAQAALTPVHYQKAAPATESQVFLNAPDNSHPWTQPDGHSWDQSTPSLGAYRDSGDSTPVSAHPVSHHDIGNYYDHHQQQQPHY
jgi:hypothetical protein